MEKVVVALLSRFFFSLLFARLAFVEAWREHGRITRRVRTFFWRTARIELREHAERTERIGRDVA